MSTDINISYPEISYSSLPPSLPPQTTECLQNQQFIPENQPQGQQFVDNSEQFNGYMNMMPHFGNQSENESSGGEDPKHPAKRLIVQMDKRPSIRENNA